MSSSTSTSTLAANAAQSSLKRTRVLYDNVHAPQSAFLPAVDPTIAQLALQRRKRRPLPQQLHWESEKKTALAIINQTNNSNGTTDDAHESTMQPVPKENANSALMATGGDAKPGGILVVRHTIYLLCCVLRMRKSKPWHGHGLMICMQPTLTPFLTVLHCILLFLHLVIFNSIEIQDQVLIYQNSNPRLARPLETRYRPFQSLGMGPQYRRRSDQ
jgi:hypothetical protein